MPVEKLVGELVKRKNKMNESLEPGPEKDLTDRLKKQLEQRKKELAQVDYQIMTDPAQRAKLKVKMTQMIEEIDEGDFDTVVFLDKSARPLSWMMQKMWQRKFGTRKMPAIHFLQMGTEFTSHPEYRVQEMWQPRTSDIEKVKANFGKEGAKAFKGKKVYIIDEVSVTQESLYAAKALIEAAFRPQSTAEKTFIGLLDQEFIPPDKHHPIVPWKGIMTGIKSKGGGYYEPEFISQADIQPENRAQAQQLRLEMEKLALED